MGRLPLLFLFLSALSPSLAFSSADLAPGLALRNAAAQVVPTPPFLPRHQHGSDVRREVQESAEDAGELQERAVGGRQVTVTVQPSSASPPGTDTVFATATITVTPTPSTVTVTQGQGGGAGTTTVTAGVTQTQQGQGTVTVTAGGGGGGGVATTVVTQGGTGVGVTTVTVVNSSPRHHGLQGSFVAWPAILAFFGTTFGALLATA